MAVTNTTATNCVQWALLIMALVCIKQLFSLRSRHLFQVAAFFVDTGW
jgi:hypothetical protein